MYILRRIDQTSLKLWHIITGSGVPEQRLPINGKTFEEQVCSVIHDVFEPSGFNVLCWTKLPYLCEGDMSQDYYWLHDAVFILSVWLLLKLSQPKRKSHKLYTSNSVNTFVEQSKTKVKIMFLKIWLFYFVKSYGFFRIC